MPSPASSRQLRLPEMARRAALLGLGVIVVAHFYVLYVPQSPGVPLFPQADKVIHATIFAAPVALGLLAGLPPRAWVTIVAVHAPLSELVQHVFLPDRTGDFFDVLADLAGVCLGVVLVRAIGRVVAGRQESRARSVR